MSDGHPEQPQAQNAPSGHLRSLVSYLRETYREAVRRFRGSRDPQVGGRDKRSLESTSGPSGLQQQERQQAMAQSDPVPFDIAGFRDGDVVELDEWNGPTCENCGWGEGEGFITRGLIHPQTLQADLAVACYVCYHSHSWNTYRGPIREASQQLLGRLMAEHTNLILKEIRRGQDQSATS